MWRKTSNVRWDPWYLFRQSDHKKPINRTYVDMRYIVKWCGNTIHICLCIPYSVCRLPIYLPVCMHVYQSTYLSACMSTNPPTCLHACLPIYLPVRMHVYQFTYLSACMSTNLPTCPHACLPIYPTAYLLQPSSEYCTCRCIWASSPGSSPYPPLIISLVV